MNTENTRTTMMKLFHAFFPTVRLDSVLDGRSITAAPQLSG